MIIEKKKNGRKTFRQKSSLNLILVSLIIGFLLGLSLSIFFLGSII